jgi:hypothetical protein
MLAPMWPGAITRYVGAKPPAGALACDGSAFDPAEYPALYVALGNSNVLPNIPGTPIYIIWTYRQLGPVGAITQWAGPTLPPDALACDGSTFSATDYPELYAALGNSNVLPNIPGTPPYIIIAT